MKKRMCILLALAIGAALPVSCLAEAEVVSGDGSSIDSPIVFSYEDMDEDLYEGYWYDTHLGYEMFLPEDYEEEELDEDMTELGLAFLAGNEETGANVTIMDLAVPEESGPYDLERFAAELGDTYETILFADLNGIPAIIYESDSQEIAGYAMVPNEYEMITCAICGPKDMSFEEFGPYYGNMIMSVSLPEEETEEAEEAETEDTEETEETEEAE